MRSIPSRTATIGGLIVLLNNVWHGWPVIITIFGWLCVFGGAIRILIPDKVRGLGEAMLQKPNFLIGSGTAQALIGALLCYFGYAA